MFGKYENVYQKGKDFISLEIRENNHRRKMKKCDYVKYLNWGNHAVNIKKN